MLCILKVLGTHHEKLGGHKLGALIWLKTLQDLLPLFLGWGRFRMVVIGTPPTSRMLPSMMPFLLLKV
jgi:hypothetical protein